MWEATDFADNPEKSHALFYIVIILAFVVLIAKIWYLQVIQGDELMQRSERQQIRELRIPAARGIILDRNNQVMAENRPSYNLFFHPEWLESADRLPFLQSVCTEFDIDYDTAKRRLDAAKGAQPIKIKSDINREEVARIETSSMTFGPKYPLEIEIESLRVYVAGAVSSHLIGYCDEIDPKRLEAPKYADYRPGDLVGKTGIEEYYEEFLAGSYGKRKEEVNARGNPIKELAVEKGLPGRNLVLNIDMDLMKTAARTLGDNSGAVVAMDPRDGSVLVAYSSPTFQPELFSRPLPKETWDSLLNDKKHPLTNKYLRGIYAPGSTYKAITSIAALESGTVTPWDMESCPGKWHFGGRDFRCHSKNGHGAVQLHYAIVHSCDVYFYKVGFQMGIDVFADWSRRFGIGSLTGIDMIGEKEGIMPDKEWKLKTQHQPWMPGDTISLAIGQGYSQVTPLQMAVAYAAIANGGTVFKPRVVNRVEDQNGNLVKQIEPEAVRQIEMKKSNLKAVREGLEGVVNEPGGTGTVAKLANIRVAGKTGTSQVRGMKARISSYALPYEYRDNAWFICYAPAENPEFLVSIVVEHVGHGGTFAAPIAKALLKEYFKKAGKVIPVEPEPIPEPKAEEPAPAEQD